jgi:hypothetical protein
MSRGTSEAVPISNKGIHRSIIARRQIPFLFGQIDNKYGAEIQNPSMGTRVHQINQ